MSFLLIPAFVLAVTAAGVPSIPTTFEYPPNPDSNSPLPHLWVSARAAVTEQQALRPDALAAHEYRMEQEQIAAAKVRRRDMTARIQESSRRDPNECDVRFAPPSDLLPSDDPATWTAARELTHTHKLVRGSVLATDVGFFFGIPATVIEISEAGHAVFLLLVNGSIEVDGVRVCTVSPNMTTAPSAGDRVVAFVGQPLNDVGTLYDVSPGRLFFEHEGHLILSPRLKRTAGTFQSLDDVMAVLSNGRKAQGR
jgi:hypothetical protein